ncbi:MAG: hypothetical protein V7K27_01750 [Nostoc sp.]|uniref:hypothetical protein n=1 Tax=Nostoc sp. TaxID=1180 RepID=UPI002FFA196C
MPLFNLEPVNLVAPQFIQLLDRKDSGVDGGMAVDSAWTNRELNTITMDETAEVTLLSNKFVLPKGSYEIFARANFYSTNATRIRLWDNTSNSLILLSSNAYIPGTSRSANNYSDVLLSGKFSLDNSRSLSLDYYCSSPQSSSANLGGAEIETGVSEIYTCIDFRKVS